MSAMSREENVVADSMQSASQLRQKRADTQKYARAKMLDRQLTASQAFVDASQQLINALRII